MAERFELGSVAVERWRRRRRENGDLEPSSRPPRGSTLEAHADWLAKLRAAEPSLPLRAVCERLAEERELVMHETTLWYWPRRQGSPHKNTLIAGERERGEVALARWLWHREQKSTECRRLVFIDEIGTATNTAPRWAQEGRKAFAPALEAPSRHGSAPASTERSARTRVCTDSALVYLVCNTISNLRTQALQVACFRNAAAHLGTGGSFVIECLVPQLHRPVPGETIVPFNVSEVHLGFEAYANRVNRIPVSHRDRIDGDRICTCAPALRAE